MFGGLSGIDLLAQSPTVKYAAGFIGVHATTVANVIPYAILIATTALLFGTMILFAPKDGRVI